jgi:hypothetical protein
MCKRRTKIYAYHLDFYYKNLLYAFFVVKKRALYVNFNISFFAKWCFPQGSIRLEGMRFCGHVLNSPRNKNLKSLNPYLLKKIAFLAFKTLLYPSSIRNFYFFSTLNIMLLQMVRNESIRFGAHVDLQLSYKILWSKVPKKAPILHNLACFQEGLFWGTFGLNATIDV